MGRETHPHECWAIAGSDATYLQLVDFCNRYRRRSPRRMSKLSGREVVDFHPYRPVGSSRLLRPVARSDQCNRRLDLGRREYSPSGMISDSARRSRGLAAVLVGSRIKGVECSGGSGDFPHPIFLKKRCIRVIEGYGCDQVAMDATTNTYTSTLNLPYRSSGGSISTRA
jgi:hypothetical protein